MQGTLIVRPKSAKLDLSFLSRSDPYAIMTIGSQKNTTKQSRNSGRSPSWTEEFRYNILNEDILRVQIYDKDILRDDFIADGQISISKYLNGGRQTDNIPLIKNGKSSGTMTVEFEFIRR